MFMRNALKPVLRYSHWRYFQTSSSLSTSTSTRNAAKSHNQPNGNLAIKLRQVVSKLAPNEPQQKSNLRYALFLITTANKGFSFFPNLVKNRILIYISKARGLRTLTQLQFSDDQPPGTYSKDSQGQHEKILAEQQRQLEALRNKKKNQGIFEKMLGDGGGKEQFPKYKPK